MTVDQQQITNAFLPYEKVVWFPFLLLVFSLPFAQPSVFLLQNRIPATDFLFLITGFIWFALVLMRKLELRFSAVYYGFAAYILAFFVSALFSTNPSKSAIKMLAVTYLLALSVLSFNLLRTRRHVKQALYALFVGAAVSCATAIITILLFYADRTSHLLFYTLSHYGTLPPGNYPRIQSTFYNPNMFCDFLCLIFAALLGCRKLEWISAGIFYLLLGGLSIAAVFTISPCLGGLFLIAGLWMIAYNKGRGAKFAGFAGIAISVLFFLSTLVTPIPYAEAPWKLNLPISNVTLYPSSRTLVQTSALQTFLANPLTGKGIGIDAAYAEYVNPSGRMETLLDAHQMWLSIASQTGVLGLITFIYLLYMVYSGVRTGDFNSASGTLKLMLSLGLTGAFLYAGLSGSFEDARHIWVWIGFCAAVPKLSS
ncbi:MAG: O-antigen ligase family protein [Pyrinomonadaceae bacterium]